MDDLKKELDARRQVMVMATRVETTKRIVAAMSAATSTVDNQVRANNEANILNAVIKSTVKRKLLRPQNKYKMPHQGNNEKWRRAFKIYKTHLAECDCPTCQFVRGAMNIQSAL